MVDDYLRRMFWEDGFSVGSESLTPEELERQLEDHPLDRELKYKLFAAYIRRGRDLEDNAVQRLLHPFESLMLTDIRTATYEGLGTSFDNALKRIIRDMQFSHQLQLQTPDAYDPEPSLEDDDNHIIDLSVKVTLTLSSKTLSEGPLYGFEMSHEGLLRSVAERESDKTELFRWGVVSDFKPIAYVYSELAVFRGAKGYEMRLMGVSLEESGDGEGDGSSKAATLTVQELEEQRRGPIEVNYWVRNKFTIL